MTKELSVVVVAGGNGRRMGAPLPKQYLELSGKPIIIRTLEGLIEGLMPLTTYELILVRPERDSDYIEQLLSKYLPAEVEVKIANGGRERAESVANGLELASAPMVMVHDGVRPFVSKPLLKRLWEQRELGAVVPAISPTDSIRIQDGERGYVALTRDMVRLVQTPQLFSRELLAEAYRAYRTLPDGTCTDDASIVERYTKQPIILVEGEERNIKMTTPKDMVLGEWYLTNEGG